MYNRLYNFLVEKNILYQKQFGFEEEEEEYDDELFLWYG